MQLVKYFSIRALVTLVLLGTSVPAKPHPMPNSMVLLRVGEEEILAELQLPLAELQLAVPYDLSLPSTQIVSELGETLTRYVLDHISLQASDGKPWTVQFEKLDVVDAAAGTYRELAVWLKFIPPNGADLRMFNLNYDVIMHQLVTHTAFLKVDEDWKNGIHKEQSEELGIIKTDVRTGRVFPFTVNLDEGSTWQACRAIFAHGMEHIQVGLDHILFLLMLLLVAPLTIRDREWSDFQGFRYTLRRFLRISLAFTLGHSITLLVGSFNLVPFQIQWIEVLIAFSILLSAVHVIRPLFPSRELGIAAGFGLIHGLAFSLTLADMELGWQQKLLSVLSFNLGIEAMQLIIMAICFPVLLLSRWPKRYVPLRIGISFLTIIVSAGWIAERISGSENVITMYLNKVFV